MALHLVSSAVTAEPPGPRADVLDQIYDEYAPQVLRWARRLAGPSADVEDLVHDVFVVALQRAFAFHGDATIKTWLFRITDLVVRSRRRRTLLRGLLFRRRQEEMADTLPVPATPLQEMERREEHERLYRALDRLSDRYRTAIILYDIEGLASDEVAELLGITVGALWVRLHRGRAKLVDLLAGASEP